MVHRYGLGVQKQVPDHDIFAPKGTPSKDNEDTAMEDDGVKAMVAGVKSRGVSFALPLPI